MGVAHFGRTKIGGHGIIFAHRIKEFETYGTLSLNGYFNPNKISINSNHIRIKLDSKK